MLLCNHRLSADEALQSGFVAEIFTVADLDRKVWPRIQEWAEMAHGSVLATKRLISGQSEQEMLAACENELYVLRQRMLGEDSFNAMMQFMSRKSKL